MPYSFKKHVTGINHIERRYIAFAHLWFDACIAGMPDDGATLDGILIALKNLNNFNPVLNSFRYAIDDDAGEVYVIRNDEENTLLITVKKTA